MIPATQKTGLGCKILGVLITLCGRTDLKILGVLNVTFFLVLKNIWGAIAPPAPPVPPPLSVEKRHTASYPGAGKGALMNKGVGLQSLPS